MSKILGFDPNKFKYESSDDKTTTLRHKNGHKITISHNALSPENKEMLEAMAKGGRVSDQEIRKQREKRDDQEPKPAGTLENFHPEGKQMPIGVMQRKDNLREYKKSPGPNLKGLAKGGSINLPRDRSPLSEASDKHLDQKKRDFYKTEAGQKTLAAANEVSDKIKKPKMAKGGNIDNPSKGLDFNEYEQQRDEANSAYDAGLPCLNPHCRSHGQPHPNCRCYSGGENFADGGEVMKLRYCAHGKPHAQGCEYMADGGDPGYNDQYLIQPYEAPTTAQQPSIDGTIQDKTTPEQDTQRHQQRDQEDEAYRAEQQRQQQFSRQGMARGGMPQRSMPGQPRPFAEGGQTDLPQSDIKGDVSNIPYGVFGVSKRQPNEHDLEEKMNAAEQAPAQDAGNDESTISDSELDQDAPPAQPQQQPQAPAQAQAAPDAQPEQPQQPQLTPQQAEAQAIHNNIMGEGRAWSADMNAGHIEPETYKSLFAKKDTLGKIGTIFGLLVGGAGAGLSHQPNALLGLMQKQIDNDIDAQKTSATNKQNYVRLAQQQELNRATMLTAAQNRKLTASQTNDVNQQAELKARMLAERAAVAHIAEQNKSITDPQQRQAADQALAMMYQKMDANNSDAASRFAASKALQNMGAAGTSNPSSETAFQQRQSGLQMAGMGDRAQFESDRHISGIQGTATRPVGEDDRQRIGKMNTLDNQLNNVIGSIDQYSNLRGNLDPRVTGPMAVKAHEAAALYNQTLDGLGMTEGRMGWLDKQVPTDPQKFMERLKGSREKLEEVAKNNRMRRDMILSGPGGYGYPKQQINTAISQTPPAPSQSKSKKPMIYNQQNKRWEYQ